MTRPTPAARVSAAPLDAGFLVAAVALSCAPYAARLGFYSDDWAFFAAYVNAPDQTVAGFVRASTSPLFAMRPVQLWLCALLYRAFGLEPLGYHLFNAALLCATAVLAYLALTACGARRPLALASALIFGLLPNYSTDRYWFVAFAVTLSMGAALASAWTDLLAAASPSLRTAALKLASVVCFLLSTLAYEVALPVLLLVPILLLWRAARHRRTTRAQAAWLVALALVDLALAGGVVLWKLHMTVRLGAEHGLARQVIDIGRLALRTDVPPDAYGLNLLSAARVHVAQYGAMLPATAMAAARLVSSRLVWLALPLGVGAFAYLWRTMRAAPWPSWREWGLACGAGALVAALGYAIFLTNYNVQFTAAGIANRSAIAASLGIALIATGLAGGAASVIAYVVEALPPARAARRTRVAPVVFAAGIAAVAACGFIIVNAIAGQWVEAYAREEAVLRRIQDRFPALPDGTTLILDGICPYAGPAVVFESNWDLAGALGTLYRNPSLAADIVTPRLSVTDQGLVTRIYNQVREYPYGPRLVMYDAARDTVHPLPDRAAARAYFAQRPSLDCPEAHEGVGVKLF